MARRKKRRTVSKSNDPALELLRNKNASFKKKVVATKKVAKTAKAARKKAAKKPSSAPKKKATKKGSGGKSRATAAVKRLTAAQKRALIKSRSRKPLGERRKGGTQRLAEGRAAKLNATAAGFFTRNRGVQQAVLQAARKEIKAAQDQLRAIERLKTEGTKKSASSGKKTKTTSKSKEAKAKKTATKASAKRKRPQRSRSRKAR